jgi:hypothetical protein
VNLGETWIIAPLFTAESRAASNLASASDQCGPFLQILPLSEQALCAKRAVSR